ncbi:MAG: RluA family pseudouridine synthase [Pirellulaceae bacterium]|nr:RluA family pseudouridine synthase [Pirellulaceae bacterium]
MLSILYEDNHLLVIDKPAGIATMGAESGPTVHSLAADYLKRKYNKPGKAFVGIVSRLDTMTSGVLVLARTSKAASRLTPQFGGPVAGKKSPPERAEKLYIAAVQGRLAEDHATWVDQVYKDDTARRMRVGSPKNSRSPGVDSQRAELSYRTMGRTDAATIVAVRLATGRKHQIRVQFADRGHAVWGDRKYRSTEPFADGIALHSCLLRITHPTLQTRLTFSTPVPPTWKMFRDALPPPEQLCQSMLESFDLRSDDAL